MPFISSFPFVGADATSVVFEDNETLQEKYESGELTGPQGERGADGADGEPGKNGKNGLYGVCGSSSTTVAKSATIDGFSLETGSKVSIKFTYENTATNPTLNINSTGAIPIMKYGTTRAGVNEWIAGAVVDFVYDGTNWLIEGQQNDENGLQLVSKQTTLPFVSSWYSVTYGDGKFVAVGYASGQVARSTDGINWTSAATLPAAASWQSVTYGNGKFVAVSYNDNRAAYSTNGINWTAATLPSSARWNSVTYGDGKFVAVVNNSDKAAYSTDGINWIETTMPSSAYWYSVTYGNGKFVAVASSGGTAAYSTNGINWTAATLPSSANWYSVAYGNGKFVAAAYGNNKAAYSTNGTSWTETTMPSNASWKSVTYGDGKFVAVATNSNKAAYSIDGVNWIATTLPSGTYWYSVTYGNGKFVAVATNSNVASYSADGIEWIGNIDVIQCKNEDVTSTIKNITLSQLTYSGTYIGNNLTGASSAITLSFPFKPKMVIVKTNNATISNSFRPGSGYWYYGFVWVPGMTSTYVNSTSYTVNISQPDETSISYYSSNAAAMLNTNGTEYSYFAVG